MSLESSSKNQKCASKNLKNWFLKAPFPNRFFSRWWLFVEPQSLSKNHLGTLIVLCVLLDVPGRVLVSGGKEPEPGADGVYLPSWITWNTRRSSLGLNEGLWTRFDLWPRTPPSSCPHNRPWISVVWPLISCIGHHDMNLRERTKKRNPLQSRSCFWKHAFSVSCSGLTETTSERSLYSCLIKSEIGKFNVHFDCFGYISCIFWTTMSVLCQNSSSIVGCSEGFKLVFFSSRG